MNEKHKKSIGVFLFIVFVVTKTVYQIRLIKEKSLTDADSFYVTA